MTTNEKRSVNRGGGRLNLSGNHGTQSPIITLRLPAALYERMEDFAAQKGVHRNQVIRAALDGFLQGRTYSPAPLDEYDIVLKAKAQRRERVEQIQAEKAAEG